MHVSMRELSRLQPLAPNTMSWTPIRYYGVNLAFPQLCKPVGVGGDKRVPMPVEIETSMCLLSKLIMFCKWLSVYGFKNMVFAGCRGLGWRRQTSIFDGRFWLHKLSTAEQRSMSVVLAISLVCHMSYGMINIYIVVTRLISTIRYSVNYIYLETTISQNQF